MNGVTISQGGVLPNIESVLLVKKSGASQAAAAREVENDDWDLDKSINNWKPMVGLLCTTSSNVEYFICWLIQCTWNVDWNKLDSDIVIIKQQFLL